MDQYILIFSLFPSVLGMCHFSLLNTELEKMGKEFNEFRKEADSRYEKILLENKKLKRRLTVRQQTGVVVDKENTRNEAHSVCQNHGKPPLYRRNSNSQITPFTETTNGNTVPKTTAQESIAIDRLEKEVQSLQPSHSLLPQAPRSNLNNKATRLMKSQSVYDQRHRPIHGLTNDASSSSVHPSLPKRRSRLSFRRRSFSMRGISSNASNMISFYIFNNVWFYIFIYSI